MVLVYVTLLSIIITVMVIFFISCKFYNDFGFVCFVVFVVLFCFVLFCFGTKKWGLFAFKMNRFFSFKKK